MQLAGKTVLVTGAGGALGSAMVRMCVDAGAQVIALDKDAAALGNLPKENLTTVICDLTDAKALEAALSPMIANMTVDVLINNAGILHSAPLVNILNRDANRFADNAAAFERVVAANLSSVFFITQLVADQMLRKRTKGIIINMSSVSANGNAGQSAYSASKAGVNAMTSVWAKELGQMGIRVVAIAPGYIDTPSTHKAVSGAQLEAIADAVPLKKLGTVEHILQAVQFAIANDYVSGTVIEVDGGLTV